MVAVQPIGSGTELLDGVRFTKISIRLWCRNANVVADAWRPCLHRHVTLHKERDMPYYESLGIYCEEGRKDKYYCLTSRGRPKEIFVRGAPGHQYGKLSLKSSISIL